MRVRFHRAATREFAEAAIWYEQRRSGLGTEFRQAVRHAAQIIGENPEAWPPWPGLLEVRSYPLRRFPFVLPYAIEARCAVILAVAHAKKRPGYWIGRLQSTAR